MANREIKMITDRIGIDDLVYFGRYVPDGIKSRPEPVLWRIIDISGNRALLLSELGLDGMKFTNSPVHSGFPTDYPRICRQRELTGRSFDELYAEAKELRYKESLEYVHWECSDVREWLNGSFYTECFSENERDLITGTKLMTDSGEEIEDKIFLLSRDEVEKYFPESYDRQLTISEFVKRKQKISSGKGILSMSDGLCDWWLRSGGETGVNYVGYDGNIGCAIEQSDTNVIRPSLWVKISV
jgi:hypothetical protein